jgi:hypothetical protein
MDDNGNINLQKPTTFGQRSPMVNVLLLLHVVLHILIESSTYIEMIISKIIRNFCSCVSLDGHVIFFLPFVNYCLFMCYGKVHL